MEIKRKNLIPLVSFLWRPPESWIISRVTLTPNSHHFHFETFCYMEEYFKQGLVSKGFPATSYPPILLVCHFSVDVLTTMPRSHPHRLPVCLMLLGENLRWSLGRQSAGQSEGDSDAPR